MAQAKGAMMQLLLQRETTFRTMPSPVAAFKVPFVKYDIGRDPKKVKDNSISASPLPGKSGCGDAEVAGNISAILDLRSIGHWLALPCCHVPPSAFCSARWRRNAGMPQRRGHSRCW